MVERAKVLTIEDEAAVRGALVTYLEDSGFRVLQAEDGPSGLEVFRRERPEVVLCDLRLPGLDGLDVLSALNSESPETAVIIVSGVGQIADAVQALKRGAWDFVTKPIQDMSVVENAVERALERAELRRQNIRYREYLERVNQELTLNVKQLQADAEAGRKLQSQLLPEDQLTIGNYVFSRRLFPSTYLSGDFVDYFPVDHRHCVFYVADVSGHGAASAFVAVMLRTLVREYRESFFQSGDMTILNPEQTLGRLDQALRRQRIGKHVTMFFGIIDRMDNRLLSSSAGQYPYPMLHDGERLTSLVCRGRPLGLFPNTIFSRHQQPLPPSFTLLLMSDGIIELAPAGELQGKQRTLHQALAVADSNLESLSGSLGLGGNDNLPDDITLLMIRGFCHA